MPMYAGIGSRTTPAPICDEMRKVASTLYKELGYTLRSGHAGGTDYAEGADYAFEVGAADPNAEIYLPWPGFNQNLPLVGKPIVVGPNPTLDDLVRKFHPAPQNLSRGAFSLMRRNGCQVLGLSATEPAKFIVCWTPGGKLAGGTAQAMRIAQAHHIPIINMYEHDIYEKVMELVYGI